MGQERKLGVLGRQVSELVEDIINHSYESLSKVIKTEVETEDNTTDVNPAMGDTFQYDKWVRPVVSSLLPTALCVGSAALKAPAAMVGILTLAGSIGSTMIMKAQKDVGKTDIPAAGKVRVSIDEDALAQARDESKKKLQRLLNYIVSYEEDNAEGYDVTTDRKFGEWLQKFLIYSSQSDDRKIGRMQDELITRLAAMKIMVYDEPVLDENGLPDIPHLDYLIDRRTDETYHEVTKPAIYTRKGLLARGEIK